MLKQLAKGRNARARPMLKDLSMSDAMIHLRDQKREKSPPASSGSGESRRVTAVRCDTRADPITWDRSPRISGRQDVPKCDPRDRDKSALHQRVRACPLSEKSINFSGTCSGGPGMRGIILALGLAALASLVSGFAATAQDENGRSKGSGITPMPPMRPTTLSAPAAPLVSAPPASAPAPGIDPMVADFAADMPEELPPASRARMDKCGSEWQKLKASGAATDKTWLSFARVCLVR